MTDYRKSICLDMLYAGLPMQERILAAAQCGFDAIEFWKWSNKDIPGICTLLEQTGLGFAVCNLDSRDEKLSYDLSRGILNAGRDRELVSAIWESAPVYHALHASAMILLVGETIPGQSPQQQNDNILRCLRAAAEAAEETDIRFVVEPLNCFDRENYFMPYAAPLMEILETVDSPRIKMLYDLYHQNRMGDFSMDFIRQHINRIGHFHVADCPGRHEPGTGSVDYVSILQQIGQTGYTGFIGAEYRPTRPEAETFGFFA